MEILGRNERACLDRRRVWMQIEGMINFAINKLNMIVRRVLWHRAFMPACLGPR